MKIKIERADKHDPFSGALSGIKQALEYALDDGLNAAMSHDELVILEKIAIIVEQEGGMEVSPRVG